ncbi:hypothetical protein CPB84DRAFT_1877892 [Gymnopilus junonius]|uniref:Orc1-like AAA ATPase domain-containing protein n=1 Tax=Gymnopilus junonius TaxID=109634 RepID=A0A9P5NCD7_GYMJU|nr:hypothetical protein CPB84DRAFT_1877892 [Gymnopilus junonius]
MSVFKKARNFVKGTTDSRDEVVDQSVPLVMSFFKKARNFSIRGGTFNSVGRDQINVDQSVHTHNYYHNATAIQERDTVSNPTTVGPKVSDAPNPSTLFQGRRTELDMLKDYFKPRRAGEPRSRRSFLLHGMGGIGKTQTCLKFIEEATNQFGYIFWIDASTPETISLGLKGIPEAKSADSDGSTKSLLQWISHLPKEWLLVFDSAEEHVHKRSTSFKAIEIEQMEEEDAVTLLLKASCLDQDPPSDAF